MQNNLSKETYNRKCRELENYFFENGFWKLSQEGGIITTAKWSILMNDVFSKKVESVLINGKKFICYEMITPDDLINGIMSFKVKKKRKV